jgi:hypothetical protein
MVDEQHRRLLRSDLQALVTGRMTTQAFDERIEEIYSVSCDVAVREIATFGWSLYSDDAIFAHRLRGRHAVDRVVRRLAARAVLFLRTDLEYGYEEVGRFQITPVNWMGGTLWLVANMGIALMVIGVLAGFARDWTLAIGCGLAGLSAASLGWVCGAWPMYVQSNRVSGQPLPWGSADWPFRPEAST